MPTSDYPAEIVQQSQNETELVENLRFLESDTRRIRSIRSGRARRRTRKRFEYDSDGNRVAEEIIEPPTFGDSLKALELSGRIAYPELFDTKGGKAAIGPVVIVIQSPTTPPETPTVIDVPIVEAAPSVTVLIDRPGNNSTAQDAPGSTNAAAPDQSPSPLADRSSAESDSK